MIGLGNTIVDVAGMTLLQRSADDEVLGRVFGILESLVLLTIALGALAAPGVLALLGVKTTLVVVGLFLPVLLVPVWPLLRRVDEAARVPTEALALLRAIRIFAPLPPPVLERLAAAATSVHVPAGTAVFQQGDHGDRFYAIAAGRAAVEIDGAESATLGAGDFFGEIALLRDVPRTATVRALDDLEVYALERDDFIAAVTGHAPSHEAAESVVAARLPAGATLVGLHFGAPGIPSGAGATEVNSIDVIGSGRVGSAVAARLRERGVSVGSGDPELVLLCVPDGAIAEVAAGIAPGPWVAHVSGATPLAALAPHERRFSVHPLQTFTRSRGPEQLDGAWAAVTGETAEAVEQGTQLAELLGLRPFELADSARTLYHAGAVFASNYVVALQRAASLLFESAGAPPEALEPLMRRTIENGFELTGPISRGDWATVEAHRAAIRDARPELDHLYETLAGATLALAT